jgi:serine O-acetyltransferase
VGKHSTAEFCPEVSSLLRAALLECGPSPFVNAVIAHHCFAQACTSASEDLHAFVAKDPAQHGTLTSTLLGSTSYKAVLHYRLAHALLSITTHDVLGKDDLKAYALIVSNRGKLLSGAEIHPKAVIGQRFVLDHGWGSVIGETAVIGDDCYMLGGVTLGATGIARNPSLKRHPTLGHRVQIGAFARILGDIHVGSDVFIGTHCCITQNIAPNSVVTLKSEIQVVRADNFATRE